MTAKKTFYYCIIPTRSDITHTGAYALILKQLTVAQADVGPGFIKPKQPSPRQNDSHQIHPYLNPTDSLGLVKMD
jgi:hypothetical protein